MYTDFVQKYAETDEQGDFYEAIEYFENCQRERNEELFKFIDEFIASEEYSYYLENKRDIVKECSQVQYDDNDIIKHDEVVEKIYPLTVQSKKMFAFAKHFEKYVEKKRNQEVLKRQEKGIQIIRIGPRKKYSQDQMNAALEAVARGIPVATAAKIPSVPRVTLMYKSSGRLPTECRMGPSTVLTTNEEDLLEKWILSLTRVHHPVNKEQLLDSDKIAELKTILSCTKESKERRKEEINRRYLETFCQTYHIDCNSNKLKNSTKLQDRIICYQKIIHSQNLKRKLNIMAIVRKLIKECEIKKEKRFRKKVHRNQDQANGKPDIVVQELMTTENENVPEDEGVDESTEESIDTTETTVEYTPKKAKKTKKKKKDKAKPKKDKKEKKSKSTKSSKKSKKSSTKEPSELILPVVQLCNIRKKINAEAMENLSDLLGEFSKFDEMMENRHILSRENVDGDIKIDHNFLCKPEVIAFNNGPWRFFLRRFDFDGHFIFCVLPIE
ncbi:hypothetical protein JTB14_018254 [Gonioctena quinquepunctata]|nr:hypothetical protein JTB14_018254 [Gonioctena quinquepunctata]